MAATGQHVHIVFAQGQNNIHFPFTCLQNNHLLSLGKHHVKLIHTPGHTMESACYLFNNKFLLTGDTLFLGDVGRPDLVAGGDPSLTKEIMADHLYSSL